MSRRGKSATTLIAIAWAVAGILAGHALTYRLLFPEGHVHKMALADSGHGWLGLLWPVALAAAAVAVASGLLAGSSRGGSRGVRFMAMAIVQVTLFAALELSERLTTGLTVAGLFHELLGDGLAGILMVGGLIQLVAAWFGSAASRLVGAVAEHLRRPPYARRAANQQPLRTISSPLVSHVEAAHAIRGPPSTTVAMPSPHRSTAPSA